MQTVGAFEAKTHFSQLLDRVEKGETVDVTRHGKLVAHIVPSKNAEPNDDLHSRVLAFRGLVRPGEDDVQSWKSEGRR